MNRLSRRRFIELALAGVVGTAIAACAPQGSDRVPTALPQATRMPVRNENRPDRNIRYYKPFVPPTAEQWQLTVGGLVTTPLTLTFADIQQFPAVEQESRMKCVECWSFKARWGGFSFASLLEQVKPLELGQYVRLTCGDDYWEVLPVEDLLKARVLFAYRMDGEFLADEYGSPLRLIVPWKYGYKGAKCITGIDLVAQQQPGYWSSVGPYSIEGDIQVGYDHPQGTAQRVQITEAGKELMY